MNVHYAAVATLSYVKKDTKDKTHLLYMVKEIQKMNPEDKKQNEKSHRWLGWLQAMVVYNTEATIEDMKKINKDS